MTASPPPADELAGAIHALTGDALCMAAAEYARTDEEAAAELNRQITANGDPPPVVVTSPKYP